MKVDYILFEDDGCHIVFIPDNAAHTSVQLLLSTIQSKGPSVGRARIDIASENELEVVAEALPGFQSLKGDLTKDASLIHSMLDNRLIKFKYIRSQGFNKNSEHLIFLFDEGLAHSKAARLLSFNLPGRCVSAGFVRNGSGQSVCDFKIGNGGSRTLGLDPLMEIDEDTKARLNTEETDQQLLDRTLFT